MTVDTARLGRRLVRDEVRNLRLQTLAAHFRSPVTPIHRALDDARATAHVLHGLLERAGSLGVTNLDDLLQLPRARGSAHYSKIALTGRAAPSAGVYLFRDRHGTPIYVGKATNLRARVRQYFYGDQRRTIGSLMRELDSVDHIVCPYASGSGDHRAPTHPHLPAPLQPPFPSPKSSHWVKLTAEPFPRLSVVRTPEDESAGPSRAVPFQDSGRPGGVSALGRHHDSTLLLTSGQPGRRGVPRPKWVFRSAHAMGASTPSTTSEWSIRSSTGSPIDPTCCSSRWSTEWATLLRAAVRRGRLGPGPS